MRLDPVGTAWTTPPAIATRMSFSTSARSPAAQPGFVSAGRANLLRRVGVAGRCVLGYAAAMTATDGVMNACKRTPMRLFTGLYGTLDPKTTGPVR
jgi:hypothetical protein